MKHNGSLPVASYNWLICRGSHLQSIVILLVRLTWGFQLYESGYRHLHNIETTVAYFRELGIPAPLANVYISGWTEMVGGILLMLGLGSRLISIPLIFNFAVAFATASTDKFKQLIHGGQLIGPRIDPGRISALDAIINDDAFPMMVMVLLILAFGPGRVSLDYVVKRLFFSKSKSHG